VLPTKSGGCLPVELLTGAEGFGNDGLFRLPDICEAALYAQHKDAATVMVSDITAQLLFGLVGVCAFLFTVSPPSDNLLPLVNSC